jgi:hypothetical protein
MRNLFAEEIVQVWESGLAQHPLDRALTLLALVLPYQTRQQLARLPIGQRDGYLLDLYEATFGPNLAVQARCPACQHEAELNFSTHAIRVTPAEEISGGALTATGAGYTLTFRLPNSLDLAAIVHWADIDMARQRLAEGCLLSAKHNGVELSAALLPADAITLLATRMAACDPQAEIELALVCPACAQPWQLLFDIVLFLWAKIDAQARRLLHEVHALAQAYGWREAEILALSAARRQFYLTMVS